MRVLRAQPGMEFDVVAGGRVWHSVIAGITGDSVRFNLIADLQLGVLGQLGALVPGQRAAQVRGQLAKLGGDRIVPVIARRSEKHLAQAAAGRVERWRRVALEASKQARRSDVLQVDDPLPLKAALSGEIQAVRLVLAEQERSTTLHHALGEALAASGDETPPIWMAVGPEGGWTPEEEAMFDAESWKPVSLGPRILRVETAAITAMAVAAALLE